KLTGDSALGIGAQRVSVGPIAHKCGVTGLPDISGLFFSVGGDSGRRDGANPAAGSVERLDRVRVVDGDSPVGLDDRAAPVAVNPLQRVAGDALTRPALKDEAVKIFLPLRAFAVLYFPGHLREFFPSLRRCVITILFQEVCP